MADDVLHAGVRGITDLITMPGLVNLDFADIRTIMTKMGKAMMGTGEASGEERAIKAAEAAIAQSREKLDSAFARLSKMQAVVDNSLNEDGTVKKSAPIRVESKRTRAAIAAPKKSAKAPVKRTAKKTSAKRK
jgi:DNA-binding IclR family transcriptional regulator